MNDYTNQGLSPINQGMENPFIIVPEDNGTNRLSIKKAVFIICVPLISVLVISAAGIVAVVNTNMPYLTAVFVAPICLLLFFCKSRIVLIKDEANNRLTVQERNYFCCTMNSYNLPLSFLDIKTSPCGAESGP